MAIYLPSLKYIMELGAFFHCKSLLGVVQYDGIFLATRDIFDGWLEILTALNRHDPRKLLMDNANRPQETFDG